ncbi:MAG: hypothetical protein QGH33_11410, partial [Pirellulaceae bacterium]|nr:hypothetical protein [Pirellulaceae bacterium]
RSLTQNVGMSSADMSRSHSRVIESEGKRGNLRVATIRRGHRHNRQDVKLVVGDWRDEPFLYNYLGETR